MAITGAQLVQDAAYQAGILGQDATPALTNDDAQLILRRLNRLADSWSNDDLMIFTNGTETFPLSAGVSAYSTSLLTNGRPLNMDAVWVTYGGVDYFLQLISDDAYGSIALKNIQAIPNVVWINPGMPQNTLTFWPVPFAPMTANCSTQRVLTTAVAMTTTLSFPPGYEKAFVDGLAVDICPAFGITPSPAMIDAAQKSMRRVKVANYSPSEVSTPFDADSSLDMAYIYKPW